MKVQLIILVILKLICHTFGETMQEGMTENLNPFTSEGDNLDLFSSMYQLQTNAVIVFITKFSLFFGLALPVLCSTSAQRSEGHF